MARKKKLIWFEQETVVGGAGEARQRGTSQSATRHHQQSEPFYGPVTVDAEDDESAEPDARRANIA